MSKHTEILVLLGKAVQVPTQGRPGKQQQSVWNKPPVCRVLAGAAKHGGHPCTAREFRRLIIIYLNTGDTGSQKELGAPGLDILKPV